MRRILYAVSLMTVLGCGGSGTGNADVLFGAVLDETGSVARPQWLTAAELAIEHANEGLAMAGGPDARFGLLPSDSNNLPNVALDRAREAVGQGAKAILTDTTDDAVEIMRTAYAGSDPIEVPVVCMACTASALFDPLTRNTNAAEQATLRNEQGWGFRTVAHTRPEARALINFFLEDVRNRGDTNGDGTQKISVEVINETAGLGFFNDLEDARDDIFSIIILEQIRHERNIDVDGHNWNEDLNLLTNDRNEQLRRNDGRPDVIMEMTFPLYAASLTRSYQEAGRTVESIPFVHHHHWRSDQTLIKLSAFDLEGHRGISHAIVDNCGSSGAAFTRYFEEALHRKPGYLDAQTYDAAFMLALATVAAAQTTGASPGDVTPAQIRDAMRSMQSKDAGAVQVVAGASGFADGVRALMSGSTIDYIGASGPVDFDDSGNVIGNFIKYEVVDGAFRTFETLDCRSDVDCPVIPYECDALGDALDTSGGA